MHEQRNAVLILLVCASVLWALLAWLIAPDYWPGIQPSLLFHQVASLSAGGVFGLWLARALMFEDRMDDELAKITAGRYFERDGLCFMPLMRVGRDGQTEISLYFQNRYNTSCEAVVQLRPPPRTFACSRGARDIHFSFIAEPGAYGVLHQPVGVAPKAQGETIEVQIAAAVRWPLGKGEAVRTQTGMPCGTLDVDWALAHRRSEHELNGEMILHDPAVVHLSIPIGASNKVKRTECTQETLSAIPS